MRKPIKYNLQSLMEKPSVPLRAFSVFLRVIYSFTESHRAISQRFTEKNPDCCRTFRNSIVSLLRKTKKYSLQRIMEKPSVPLRAFSVFLRVIYSFTESHRAISQRFAEKNQGCCRTFRNSIISLMRKTKKYSLQSIMEKPSVPSPCFSV